jgi:hypothetical protein
LKDEKPLWPLSVYSPQYGGKTYIGKTDVSPEEARWVFLVDVHTTGKIDNYVSNCLN